MVFNLIVHDGLFGETKEELLVESRKVARPQWKKPALASGLASVITEAPAIRGFSQGGNSFRPQAKTGHYVTAKY